MTARVTPATVADGVPDAPSSVTATAILGGVEVSWNGALANGSPVTQYTATASPGGASMATAGYTVTFTDLDYSTAYTFTVTATNAFGTGPPAGPTAPVTPLRPRQEPTVFASGVANAVAIGPRYNSRALLVVGSDGTLKTFGDPLWNYGNKVELPHPAVAVVYGAGLPEGYLAYDSHGCSAGAGLLYDGKRARTTFDVCSANLNAPIVDVYGWYVSSDGGIFEDSALLPFKGSMGGQHLNAPVVGLGAPPDGSGYWEAAADGGVFAFGAPFLGSMGGQHLNAPVTDIVSVGSGYMLVAADGGVFNFGTPFFGSLAGTAIPSPIVDAAESYDANGRPNGYWMLDSAGDIYTFASALAPGPGQALL